jgi:hypothetical protein
MMLDLLGSALSAYEAILRITDDPAERRVLFSAIKNRFPPPMLRGEEFQVLIEIMDRHEYVSSKATLGGPDRPGDNGVVSEARPGTTKAQGQTRKVGRPRKTHP